MLTFDGNKSVKEKVTFSRIQEHLQGVCKRKFSHGTVIQLCVARNWRHRSASRYKGVAQITCRRARKGFQLRYNPDNHWSAAMYRGLSHLQYKDGLNLVNINRDDASGFRLDTLTNHQLHRSPVVRSQPILTTHTDYVNNYPSLLQTTSYNFTRTHTMGEICYGVVKGADIFPKNPAQHFSYLKMLEGSECVQPNPTTGSLKQIECVRFEGATDEGPSHLEVQYWWTLRHIQHLTLVPVTVEQVTSTVWNYKMDALPLVMQISLYSPNWMVLASVLRQGRFTRID